MSELYKGITVEHDEYTESFVHYAEDCEGSLLGEGSWADLEIKIEELLWDQKLG